MSLPLTQAGSSSPSAIFKFDASSITFDAAMAKRPGQGPFDAAILVQGDVGSVTNSDVINYTRGTQIGNLTGQVYSNLDGYQGTIVLWITPEYDGDDGLNHSIWRNGSANPYLYKDSSNNLTFQLSYGTAVSVSVASWVAGTTYQVTVRWDTKRTIDGTNKVCISVNDSHTFGSPAGSVQPPEALQRLGCRYDASGIQAGNALIEGFTLYRRVLFDGTYGTPPVDRTDELAAIYAAGAGLDPAQVTGSWDVCLCVPTNCSTGALVTGNGEAWSHPHSSSIIDRSYMSDGDPPGTPYAVELNGTSTYIGCGSGATLDDIPSGGQITFGAWVRLDADPITATGYVALKGLHGTRGWDVYYDYNTNVWKIRVGPDTPAQTETFVPDGKFHYIAGFFDDTANTGRISIDGRWGAAQAMASAYVSEAADSLILGGTVTRGAIAWAAIWNDDHHTAGTDFVPPRTPPGAGGSLVECWNMSEGTGVTAAATVTSPANDGTITSGSWSRVWEFDATGTYPQSLLCDGTSTLINYGSGANVDDLPLGAFTAEGWFAVTSSPSVGNTFIGKQNTNNNGWFLGYTTLNRIYAYLFGDGGSCFALWTLPTPQLGWHHFAMTFDAGGDSKVYLYVDGVLRAVSNALGVAYVTDAAASLYISNAGQSGWGKLTGRVGWHRISNSVRYSGATIGKAYFVPDARDTPPGSDANAMLLVAMTDGAGTATTDLSASGYNGTITMGSGRWLNTTDMETESSSERVYPWGYSFASAAANDGITVIEDAQVTPGVSYVVRATLSIGMSGRAKPYVYLYDNIGAAQISANFAYPFMTGTHDGAGNAATLQDSTARWVINTTGWTLYNVTDGSSTTVTSNTQTTQVGTLSGGTDNDWDAGDVYLLRPPSYGSYSHTPWAETFVFTAPAGCTSVDVKILNSSGEGIVHVHQVEVYASMLVNGDHESLDGGSPGAPELITGWTNNNLDAGDTEPEATIVHAGAQSLEWNPGASSEGMRLEGSIGTVGAFYGIGGWTYGDGTKTVEVGGWSASRSTLHNTSSLPTTVTPSPATRWTEAKCVVTAVHAAMWPHMVATVNPVGDRYTDDVYMFRLTDVSLTATPASQANSAESGGVRMDGTDKAYSYAPMKGLNKSGALLWRTIPRHSAAVAGEFQPDTSLYGPTIYVDANNYVALRYRFDLGEKLYLSTMIGGVNTLTEGTLASPWVAGTEYLMKLTYGSSGAKLYVDGGLVVSAPGPVLLPSAPTTVYWCTLIGTNTQPDLVIKEP